MTKWAAVIGSPIAHSLSPILHQTAFRLVGLDWDYRRYEVDIHSLGPFMEQLDEDCVGLSVTMPCKNVITQYADTTESLAKAVGASNTLVVAAGMRACFNTDVHGIVQAIVSSYEQPLVEIAAANRSDGASAVILGTGATASSALAALLTLGVTKVSVVGRTFTGPHNVLMAANRLKVGFDPVPWKKEDQVIDACEAARIIVSTVPGSVTAPFANRVRVNSNQRLLDVDYSHGDTTIVRAFASEGAKVISPLAMLVHQGLAQVKLMSGREAPFEPVYEAVTRAANV